MIFPEFVRPATRNYGLTSVREQDFDSKARRASRGVTVPIHGRGRTMFFVRTANIACRRTYLSAGGTGRDLLPSTKGVVLKATPIF